MAPIAKKETFFSCCSVSLTFEIDLDMTKLNQEISRSKIISFKD